MLKKIRTSGEALPGILPRSTKKERPDLARVGILPRCQMRALTAVEQAAIQELPLEQRKKIEALFRRSR